PVPDGYDGVVYHVGQGRSGLTVLERKPAVGMAAAGFLSEKYPKIGGRWKDWQKQRSQFAL
ncbi:MAG: hypothetical protein K2N63_14850, partial [Lachnospiraceae bacterium]|nr:hypothetical protein [Lachnospiraceae bacterium]